ncbi:hypothetical protein M948_14815 [Virgibacillus sp. CM-4]|uniref:YolD-like family protein n=1 Tax=Virgibacillus sp. CM-4 TaxID=1354277 RepID=UPI0003885315|nr:YolD-like family protein [Virgibacillus sp. CM-4]EQB36303.1 hypothetical protein M948_14815 [Virgibacillus sp. CM-4]
MLKEINDQQDWKEKPIISDFQKEKMNLALQLALKDDLTIELEYFKNHVYHKIKGKLLGVGVLNQFVTIDDQTLPLDSLTGAWID